MSKSRKPSRAVRLGRMTALAHTLVLPALAGAAGAQALPPTAQPSGARNDQSVSEVVITGSRAITNGNQAPTPVTVVTASQLRAAAPASLADALNQLPVLQNSLRPTSTGSSATGAAGNGANLLSLRGLGAQRTLVLLDGRRMVPSNTTGSTDVNLVPESLVKRVDVVTGGASAAYGSDAVAGVVNFVLDTKFEGLKGDIQGGLSSRGDDGSDKGSLTFGKSFANDRGHILASAEASHEAGIGLDYNGRSWAEQGWGLIPSGLPAGAGPSNVIAPNVRYSIATYGGLITGPSVLANTEFLPGGATQPFVIGNNRSASVMSGGDGAASRTNLVPSLTTQTVFLYGDYDVSDNLKAFATVNYGQVTTKYAAITGGNQSAGNAYTIFSDNAFLPAALKTRMAQLGITQFTLGRYDRDWGPVNIRTLNDTWDFTGGMSGKLGGSWSFDAYYEYGRGIYKTLTLGDPEFAHMYQAADAVVNPASGQIVCRTTLTSPGNGCVPINLFGEGAPSAAAIAYVTGTAASRLVTEQNVASASMRGEPFSTWAGPVSLAFGAEYRKEQASQVVDAISASVKAANGVRGFPTAAVGTLGGFQQSNPQPIAGEYSIKEGFVEADVPLAKDLPLAYRLSLNAAYRYADYSSAGGASTWKVGLSYSPVEDIRLRVTQSRDIRAPNIAELFTSAQQTNGVGARDPQNGGQTFVVVQQTTGNVALQPEKADTFTLGLVYQPSWLPRASFSADYYDIDISAVISPLTVQQVIDGCGVGNQTFCGFITRNTDTLHTINTVRTPTFNLDARKTRGVDFEASYSTPTDTFLRGTSGDLTLRLLATYIAELTTVSSGVALDRAGEVGGTALAGAPHWQGVASANYTDGPLSLYAQARYIGGGKFDASLTPAQLANNKVGDVIYFDLTAQYKFQAWGADYEAYGTINNVFDQDPPLTPNGAVTTPRSANGNRYDFVGRYFTSGLRFKF
jgi:iron complex outermembrane receptor protein